MSSDFQKARSAFEAYAAGVLHVPADKLDVAPREEAHAGMMTTRTVTDDNVKLTVGDLWAFTASPPGRAADEVRGWARCDGSVVTYRQHLGQLFDAAKVWSAHPALDADALASLIVWSMERGHRIEESDATKVAPPTLHMDAAKGTGTLKFMISYQQAGGGGSQGPKLGFDLTVTLTPAHEARLTRSKNKSGSPDASPLAAIPVGP